MNRASFSSAPPRRASLPAGRPILARKLGLGERHWPYLVAATLIVFALVVLVAIVLSGVVVSPSWGGRNVRGYTHAGLTFGVLAVGFTLVTLLFSLRKRLLQESMRVGTMMGWLWIHVYAGILALVAAFLHAGFGAFSGDITTGKVLLFVFVLLGLSGTVWRLAYKIVPSLAAPQIANYSAADAHRRMNEHLLLIEKLAAGKSDAFHELRRAALHGAGRAAIAHFWTRLAPPEQEAAGELLALVARRERAARRIALQRVYTRFLQAWRYLHVPLSAGAILLLVVHVAFAFEIPTRALPPGAVTEGPIARFQSSASCRECHQSTYDAWSASMHAHAMSSPITLAQNNQDLLTSLKGHEGSDLGRICINCHGPSSAAMSEGAVLPLGAGRLAEGVDCTSCHQFDGEPVSSGGGSAARFQRGLGASRTYFGGIADPVGNWFHKSRSTPLYAEDPNRICKSCHDVGYDKDGDGALHKGKDLVLQTTYSEYERYRASGGSGTCISCHMPVVRGQDRAADSANIFIDQDMPAPPRVVHDHSFVGVDYPMEEPVDRQRKRRHSLLESAAAVGIEATPPVIGRPYELSVNVTNVGGGHDLPTGFAFARQMWLEVTVRNDEKTLLASGVLARSTDDLCDATTMSEPADRPVRRLFRGCASADPQLALFQLALVDAVEAASDPSGRALLDSSGEAVLRPTAKGRETWLQFLGGGPVARRRPKDKAAMTPLAPGEKRSFRYSVPGVENAKPLRVQVRLLFRHLPPYFVRALGDAQPKGEEPRVGPLADRIEVVQMATKEAVLTPREVARDAKNDDDASSKRDVNDKTKKKEKKK